MMPIDEYMKRARIDPEKIGKDAVKLIEDAAKEFYKQGRDNHPDPRYRAIRQRNRELYIRSKRAEKALEDINLRLRAFDSERQAALVVGKEST